MNTDKELLVVEEGYWGNVGDTFTFVGSMWKNEVNTDNYRSCICLNDEAMQELLEDGVIAELPGNSECICCDCYNEVLDKLNDTANLVNDLLDKYHNNLDQIAESYDNDEIPECVYVEGKTVYYNLITVLKEIQNTLEA